jgi:hypothetical protein
METAHGIVADVLWPEAWSWPEMNWGTLQNCLATNQFK